VACGELKGEEKLGREQAVHLEIYSKPWTNTIDTEDKERLQI
jgi:hypothetical protein